MDERLIERWDYAMTNITLKGIIDEDFVNYRVPSMTLMFPYCNFKCGENLCQNSDLVKQEDIKINIKKLCERYLDNPITKSIVCQGLDPMDSYEELLEFIKILRYEYNCNDDIVIYTGYNEDEIKMQLMMLSMFDNIVIKFGRYIPNQTPHFDEVLGVKLASDNQFARRLVNE